MEALVDIVAAKSVLETMTMGKRCAMPSTMPRTGVVLGGVSTNTINA